MGGSAAQTVPFLDAPTGTSFAPEDSGGFRDNEKAERWSVLTTTFGIGIQLCVWCGEAGNALK
jgi:hypothetical protein